MKDLFIQTVLLVITTSFSYAQNGFPNYYIYKGLVSKADSLYQDKDYLGAARLYEQATQVKLEKALNYNFAEEYYNAARCLAKAGKKNEAFDQLNILIARCRFSNVDQLVAEADFMSLHGDKNWDNVAQQAQSNYVTSEKEKKRLAERLTYAGKSKAVIFQPHNETVRQYLDNDSLPFLSVNEDHFRIYFKGNSYAAKHLPELKTNLNTSFQRVLSICHDSVYYHGINMIMVDSAGECRQLTGYYIHGGMSMPDAESVLIVYNEKNQNPLRHELFHFISNDLWGSFSARMLQEGGAVYAECQHEAVIDTITAAIFKERKMFALRDLIANFDDKARENEIIAYFEGASVFKFLYERYGVETLKQIWLRGFSAFENICGKPLADMEKEWSDYIRALPVPNNYDWTNAALNAH